MHFGHRVESSHPTYMGGPHYVSNTYVSCSGEPIMLLPLVVVVDFSKRERASERLDVVGQGDGRGRTLRLISLIALVKEGKIGTFTFTMDVFVLASILALRQQIKYCCPGGDNEYSQYSGCHCHCGLRFTGRYLPRMLAVAEWRPWRLTHCCHCHPSKVAPFSPHFSSSPFV